jgi:hypothetical protein
MGNLTLQALTPLLRVNANYDGRLFCLMMGL